MLGQLEQRQLRRPLTPPREQRDCAAIMRAGGERAADGELDPLGPVLADEQEHVDHLPGRLGGAVTALDLLPQLIEAGRPAAALALLPQRQRSLERSRLALEELEVVVEPRGRLEAALQPRVPSDLAPRLRDHDLARADPGGDAQADQRDRYRVAVLPDRDQGLRVDAR
jgi:hypothetical protein